MATNWEFRLVAFARAHAGRAFRWGSTDCYSLARAALEVVYDADVLPAVMYSRQEAAQLVAESFTDMPGALAELGAEQIAVGFAQQGDLLLMPGDDGEGTPRFAVVVDGRGRVLTSDPGEGVQIVELATVPEGTSAWRWPK